MPLLRNDKIVLIKLIVNFHAKSLDNLEIQLVTYEIYKCEDCDVKFTKLSDMKNTRRKYMHSGSLISFMPNLIGKIMSL